MQLDPELVTVSLDKIRPAQMTIGHAEVARKRKEISKMSAKQRDEFFANTFLPAVKGPKGLFYPTDHHHVALAVLAEGGKTIKVGLMDELEDLDPEEFWIFMDHRAWVHCYDTRGRRRPFSEMPKHLGDMADDPYRSLAAEVRRQGGFAKADLPFLEFLCANFFRSRVKTKDAKHPSSAIIKHCCKLASSSDADYLPGWAGK